MIPFIFVYSVFYGMSDLIFIVYLFQMPKMWLLQETLKRCLH
jgi:hypothetical protein